MLKLALVIGVFAAGSAQAATRRYYDAQGHPRGRSESQGNLTRFYDKDGHPQGETR